VIAHVTLDGQRWEVDLGAPIDLSVGVRMRGARARAYGLPYAAQRPFAAGGFVGDLDAGGPVNCRTLTLHPHGDGTHTESAQHVIAGAPDVGDIAPLGLIPACIVTAAPAGTPARVGAAQLRGALGAIPASFLRAVVVRTGASGDDGFVDWTGSDPPALDADTLELLVTLGVEHLLVDLPSIDPESDGGALVAHHVWWRGARAAVATITEMVYVPAHVTDGPGLLALGVPDIATDAVPSRPLFFPTKALP
jgi:arylformamidase